MKFPSRTFLLAAAACWLCSNGWAAESWKAGAAASTITPRHPVWMAGYGNRDHPSEGMAQELYAKALALEDPAGRRQVIVTTDLIGFPKEVSGRIAARVQRRYRLSRERLALTSSHTHAGPTLGNSLPVMYDLTPQQAQALDAYTAWLEDRIVSVIGDALAALEPASLSYHRGRAGFAMNRRLAAADSVKLGVNPKGPVDHDVPVLKVSARDGRLLAALYSYACHNTTLTGGHYQFHGDYAGDSQERFEKDHPGAVALFMMGCGADANPDPKGDLDIAEEHGNELAAAVMEAISGPGESIQGMLGTDFQHVAIPLTEPPAAEHWRSLLSSEDRFARRQGGYFLEWIERQGSIFRDYPYPVQVVQLGDKISLVALGGEVVVDYALKLKELLGAEETWVVGYANDVMAYIPTVKVLDEGGYEADRSQIYYGMPGKWAPGIESIILDKARSLVEALRARAAPPRAE